MTYASQRDGNKGTFARSMGLLRLICKYPSEAALTFLQEVESLLCLGSHEQHTLEQAREIYTRDLACNLLSS